MTYAEINEKYTAVVMSYLSRGYIINTSSMEGTESGEVAHVDLTNGTEVVRVLLSTFYEIDENYEHLGGLQITAGVVKEERLVPNAYRNSATVWNRNIEADIRLRFYEVAENRNGEKFYGEMAEASANNQKRYQRRRDRRLLNHPVELKVTQALVNQVKRHYGFSSASVKNLSVYRCANNRFYTVALRAANGNIKRSYNVKFATC